jgi:ubiquinone/menaquinone biosynthesis C-methylase UbiE
MPTDSDKAHPPVCDYEGSDYQSRFWDQGHRAYEDQVEAIALKRLLPSGGRLMFEVGAGAGRNTPRYHGFERVVLMDYSLSQLQQAQERLGRKDRYIYVAADVYRLPFVPGLFDAATMIRVLHHMADAPLALAQIRETLQPDAIFVLEFANKHNLKAILRYIFRRQEWNPFTPEPVEFVELNFDFHPKTVRQWLKTLNFQVQRHLTVSYFRLDIIKRLLPLKLLVGMDSLLQLTGNVLQLSPSVFVRAQAVGGTPRANNDTFFRCPACKHALPGVGNGHMACSACGLRWGIQDGIYNFKEPLK